MPANTVAAEDAARLDGNLIGELKLTASALSVSGKGVESIGGGGGAGIRGIVEGGSTTFVTVNMESAWTGGKISRRS